MRKALFAVFLAAVVATAVGFAGPARAVPTVAYSWVVPCNDFDGVGTDETLPGFEFIPGTYVLTATGACTLDDAGLYGIAATSPCSVVLVGTGPCVGATVSNIPGELCWTSIGAATTRPCDPNATANTGCELFTVRVTADGKTACISAVPGAIDIDNTVPMRAVFVDFHAGVYFDNTGAFVVTATRI